MVTNKSEKDRVCIERHKTQRELGWLYGTWVSILQSNLSHGYKYIYNYVFKVRSKTVPPLSMREYPVFSALVSSFSHREQQGEKRRPEIRLPFASYICYSQEFMHASAVLWSYSQCSKSIKWIGRSTKYVLPRIQVLYYVCVQGSIFTFSQSRQPGK